MLRICLPVLPASQAGDYSLVQAGEDLREGFILSVYLHKPAQSSTVGGEPSQPRVVEQDFDSPRVVQSAEEDMMRTAAAEKMMPWERPTPADKSVAETATHNDLPSAAEPAVVDQSRVGAVSTATEEAARLKAVDQSRVAAIAAAKDEAARVKVAARELESALRTELFEVKLQAEQEQRTLSAKLESSQRDVEGASPNDIYNHSTCAVSFADLTFLGSAMSVTISDVTCYFYNAE